jgi:hypothetical protein
MKLFTAKYAKYTNKKSHPAGCWFAWFAWFAVD